MAEKKKEVRQIVSGKVKEKTVLDKASDVFLSEDTRTVKNYILWDVLIPAIKNSIADVVIGGIEMALFGSSRGRRSSSSSRYGGGTYVSYDNYYRSDSRSGSSNRVDRNSRPDRYDFSSIQLNSRTDAEEVVFAMEELVKKYGEANVSDLNSLVGVTSRHTDNKWGWTDVRDFNYRRSGRGYILDFAPPIFLD